MALEHIHQVKRYVPRERLRELMRRTNRHAALFLIRHCAILALTGYGVWLAKPSIWFVPAAILHGVAIVHLFSPQHEFAHRTAFRTRWLNDVLGSFFGFLILLPNVYFRWEHTNHHSYTQNTRLDPQLIAQPKTLGAYLLYLSSIPYWQGFLNAAARHLRGQLTREEKRFIPKQETGKVIWEIRVMVLLYALIILSIVVFQFYALLWYWLLPRFVAEPYMRWVRMTEHVGRPTDNADLMSNTRTVLTNSLSRWLAWNMPYHAEHHLAPSIPFHALPALHKEVKGHHGALSKGYLSAHREILHNIQSGMMQGEEA